MFRIWMDFETGGLDAQTCGLTQMAYIIEDSNRQIAEEGVYNIRPFEGSTVDPKALQVTNKTWDQVMSFPDEGEVLADFLSKLGGHIDKFNYDQNFTVGAYNANFDMGFLSAWMDRHNKKFYNYFNYHAVDPLALGSMVRFEG